LQKGEAVTRSIQEYCVKDETTDIILTVHGVFPLKVPKKYDTIKAKVKRSRSILNVTILRRGGWQEERAVSMTMPGDDNEKKSYA
jgi:hypothetical protein